MPNTDFIEIQRGESVAYLQFRFFFCDIVFLRYSENDFFSYDFTDGVVSVIFFYIISSHTIFSL